MHFKGEINLKRGAIFDMDGTLLDTERYFRRVWVDVAEYFGEEKHEQLGFDLSGTNKTQVPAILRKYYPNIDVEAYYNKGMELVKELEEKELLLLPGTKEILEYLKENNVVMSVASSTKHSTIETNLHRTGILQYFDVIVGGDEVASGKPSPEIFLKAAEKMNLPPQDCYVFEDSFNGIRAGHNAGCAAIMIPNQRQPTEEMRNLSAGIYNSLKEAMKAIKLGEI